MIVTPRGSTIRVEESSENQIHVILNTEGVDTVDFPQIQILLSQSNIHDLIIELEKYEL